MSERKKSAQRQRQGTRKRAYTKPTIRDEEVFERKALQSCGKEEGACAPWLGVPSS